MNGEKVRCIDVVDLATEWMEGALTDEERSEIEEHLVVCAPCATFVRQMRLTRSALAGVRPSLPPQLRSQLLGSFAGWSAS